MDRIKQLLAQIITLSDESLAELRWGSCATPRSTPAMTSQVMLESFDMALDRAGKALRLTVPVTASGVSRAAV